jgi:hypothetical protein
MRIKVKRKKHEFTNFMAPAPARCVGNGTEGCPNLVLKKGEARCDKCLKELEGTGWSDLRLKDET